MSYAKARWRGQKISLISSEPEVHHSERPNPGRRSEWFRSLRSSASQFSYGLRPHRRSLKAARLPSLWRVPTREQRCAEWCAEPLVPHFPTRIPIGSGASYETPASTSRSACLALARMRSTARDLPCIPLPSTDRCPRTHIQTEMPYHVLETPKHFGFQGVGFAFSCAGNSSVIPGLFARSRSPHT